MTHHSLTRPQLSICRLPAFPCLSWNWPMPRCQRRIYHLLWRFQLLVYYQIQIKSSNNWKGFDKTWRKDATQILNEIITLLLTLLIIICSILNFKIKIHFGSLNYRRTYSGHTPVLLLGAASHERNARHHFNNNQYPPFFPVENRNLKLKLHMNSFQPVWW